MNSNAIHDEIRRTRDALVRECGEDLQRLGEHLRAGEARWAAAGHPVVSFAGQAPLELPPPDWEKIDAEPEDEIMTEIRATRRQMMAECGGDLGKLFARARQRQTEQPDPNHPVVSFIGEEAEAGSCVVREDPPQPERP